MFSPRHPAAGVAVTLGCLLTLSAAVVPPAYAAPTPSAARTAPATGTATVTLITGDTVTVGKRKDGRAAVAVKPAAGGTAAGSFTTLRKGDDTYVVPDRAAGLVPKVLDLELFNVTDLVEMRYDDAATDVLPVIVQGPRPLAALGAVREQSRPLPSIDAVAVNVPKRAAASFATTLSAPAGVTATGVTKVWLDRKFEASEYDANLVQIGAPQVWESGLSGAGVDVAVLDTGVDAEHPDLRGQVTAEANFTADPSAADGNGHGTHVASIIAGTGAAAGGARKGVAYGARLMSGKVLDSTGGGQESWIIAGMEWAAKQGADVINMSLGRDAGESDDPVAQAVDALTAETGALFVVAAGNSGPYWGSIGSPGVAQSALTVGAANPDGTAAMFSGAGPTRGTWRTKPDLIAPGVGITAARAGGGSADPYTAMSGTSMATPHVAGAAALLKQQHPDWDWQRIKTMLTITADASGRDPVYAAGAGLLDLPDAVGRTLLLNRGNVDFGYLRYPDGAQPKTLELTLTNTGTAPRTVAITDQLRDVHERPAAEDLLTVSPSELTIASGATERVVVTLTPANGAPGLYGGTVSVTGDGAEPLTLPTGFWVEPPRHDVRLTVLDRRGEPWAGGEVWVANAQTLYPETGGGFQTVHLDENGQGKARMLPGPLSLMANVVTPAADGAPATIALAGSPEVMLDSDMSFTIDARKAKRLRAATVEGVRTAVSQSSVHYSRRTASGDGDIQFGFFATAEEITDGQVFLQPTEPVRHGTATVETRWELDAVDPRGNQAQVYQLALGGSTVSDPPAYGISKEEARDLARLESDYPTLPGVEATRYESWATDSDAVGFGFLFLRPVRVPQRRVELVTAHPNRRWQQCLYDEHVAGLISFCTSPATTYRAGERLAPAWLRAPAPATAFAEQYREFIIVPVRITDGAYRSEILYPGAEGNETLRLWRDGVELTRAEDSEYFDSPPGPALFRLEHASSPDHSVLPIGRTTRTVWTFRSQAPTDPDQWSAKARPVNVDYQPGTDGHGFLPAGMPLVLGARLFATAGYTDEVHYERGSLRFWASTNQGKRWHETIVTTNPDGSFRIVVPGLVPRAGDAVSVRVVGSATDDRTIEQTIIDAYPVR